MGSSSSKYEHTGPRTHVLIIGSSFGGRMLTKQLLGMNPKAFKITLMDKQENFEFLPTAYKALAGSQGMDNISEPHANAVKSLSYGIDDTDVSFVRGLLKSIDPTANKVLFERITEGADPSVPI